MGKEGRGGEGRGGVGGGGGRWTEHAHVLPYITTVTVSQVHVVGLYVVYKIFGCFLLLHYQCYDIPVILSSKCAQFDFHQQQQKQKKTKKTKNCSVVTSLPKLFNTHIHTSHTHHTEPALTFNGTLCTINLLRHCSSN